MTIGFVVQREHRMADTRREPREANVEAPPIHRAWHADTGPGRETNQAAGWNAFPNPWRSLAAQGL